MNLQWKGASDPQNLTEPFFAFSKDITMLKKWFISAFPEIQKISQNLGPKKLKIESLMKRCIGKNLFSLFRKYYDAKEVIHFPDENLKIWAQNASDPQNLTETVFRFFERYYDAKEVIHKRISWNWENISKSGPKVRPKIVKNWIFNEKVHRIRKTSQNRFSLFRKILRC